MFKSTDIIYNDVGMGFSSGIGIRNGRFIEYSDASKTDDVYFNVDIRGGRRMADILDYENWFVQSTFSFEGILNSEWKIEVAPKRACAGMTISARNVEMSIWIGV